MPDLDFSVESARAVAFSAVPALALKLRIVNGTSESIRSIGLTAQVRIAASRRSYNAAEQSALLDVFGEPARWGQTVKSLLWTISSVQVPAFDDQTTVDLPVQCTYDFEVVSAKYFRALEDGLVPLEVLFSGTVFFDGPTGLQVEQIGWDKEARFGMPVAIWQDVMRLYFPSSAWLRVHQDTFDELCKYRSRNALPTWDATLERLLETSQQQEPRWTR